MILSTGATYTNNTTDLAITIKNIHYESAVYYKVRAVIFNKKNGIVYENKHYKLLKSNIKSWRKL